jgi:hypothetical protein
MPGPFRNDLEGNAKLFLHHGNTYCRGFTFTVNESASSADNVAVSQTGAFMTDNQSSRNPVWFCYKITLSDNSVKEFRIELDPLTLGLLTQRKEPLPQWTLLDYKKCPVCPLAENSEARCPVAVNLVEPLEYFKKSISYEQVEVEILTELRTYKKQTDLQHALSSMIGIYMVTSGCPVLDKLRPMIRTHLPFASLEETTYRSISMYLLAQYFLWKKGGVPDWGLKNLSGIYEEIQKVNISFRKRIMALQIEDAALNAICHLGCYAHFTNSLLLDRGLAEMEQLFQPYWQQS